MPNQPDDWKTTVTFCGDSDRVRFWKRVLATDTIPVVSPLPSWCNLPGLGLKLCYQLDLKAISPEMMQALINATAQRFNLTAEEVGRDLLRLGMPILADDVTMMCADQAFMFSMVDDGE